MSTPKRFFVENIDYPETREVVLGGDEFVHAKTVLRVEVGQEIVLLDNSGREYSAIVTAIEKHSLSANITGVTDGDKEPNTPIYLLCGALKGDKTELVVQKAVELGVSKIGVFSSRYCSAFINANKLERLNRVSKEAAKQCLRSSAPEVVFFEKFEDALESARDFENKLFFCEFAEKSDINLSGIAGSTALIVGSEGGFCEEEFNLARDSYGFSGITLGKRILRAETAAISACTLAAFVLGELQ